MQKILSDKEINQIIDDLEQLDQLEPIDFSDIDYPSIERRLRSGPAANYLPPPNPDYQNCLPPLSEDGGIDFEVEGEKVHVPPAYLPMVNFAFYNFSSVGSAVVTSSNMLEQIWKYILNFMEWVFRIKRTAKKQLREILENADQYYQELRDSMKLLKVKYNDSTFEVIFLLPDLFVYMCRLLADKEVSKKYKVLLAAALIYLVSPIDLIPEAIIKHPIAYSDDLALVLLTIKRGFDGKYVTKSQVKKHWPGDMDLLENIGEWYAAVVDVLGGEFIGKILTYLGRKFGFC